MSRPSVFNRVVAQGSRRAFAVLMLVWINLAMLPCSMAMQSPATEGDCPGCPPSHEQAMASHHGHDAATEGPDCATMQPNCCELDQGSFDNGNQKLEKNDGDKSHLVVDSIVIGDHSPALQRWYRHADPPGLIRGSPRLHAINCVYLD